MAKKQFKAESKKLLDIVINSIYTHKEIFLRELISNASDALDKRQFYLLTSKNKDFDKKDLLIRLIVDEKNRTLTIKDTGIGMNKEELENNLGIIAKSGTEEFKQNNKANKDIIGHFGVGFYSSFMVAKKVTVITKKDNEAFMWESEGIDGYSIKETIKDEIGTDIILELKEDNDDENYSDYLEERTIKNLIKKYSNFIRYPIIMKVTKSKPKDNKEDEYEDYEEEETLNTMVSIWQKNKKDLKDEDYENFYYEQKFGYEKPIKVIHYNVEGLINFNSILYIPGEVPFDFYTKEFEKGLELYSNNVLITEKSKELLPDYFGFIKGVVDSPDVSLNLSREVIQHDKQLQFIAKKIKEKIQKELLDMLKEDREKYEEFYDKFGKIIKFGVYSDWGMNNDTLQDLLMFYSSKENKLITLDEYVNKMINEQKYIYYVTGSSIEKIKKMPQIEVEKEKEHDILFLIDEVDEYAIKALYKYKDKEFK
ncbi:MAG: molecular chaperone HtpG, partial [Bacilli bacterium]|nr:molecular chaperone HtpG [Bacilli bacterium]